MPDDALSNALPVFVCPRQPGDLRLTPATCARLYQRSKAAPPWDASTVCCGCPIGAEHAGEPPPRPVQKVGCCWCGKSLGSARRLVLGRSLCPSCANRLYEHAREGYRRTTPTGIAKSLHVFVVHLEESADDPDPGCPQP